MTIIARRSPSASGGNIPPEAAQLEARTANGGPVPAHRTFEKPDADAASSLASDGLDDLHGRLIDSLLRQPPSIVLLGGVIAAVVEAAVYARSGDPLYGAVALAMLLVATARAVLGARYVGLHGEDSRPADGSAWGHMYVLSALAQTAPIGASSLYAFVTADAGTAFLLSGITIGAAASALRNFVLPGLVRWQIANLMVPLAIGCALSPHPHSWALMLSAVCFAFVTDGIVGTMHRVTVGSMRLSDERGRLCARLAEANARVTYLAFSDSLTGLPNRRAFVGEMEERLACLTGAGGLAVLTVDLDGFKRVNDRFGHESGDALLREVAKRLLLVLEPEDFIARIGGDEFVLLVGGLDARGRALALADELCRLVQAPYQLRTGQAEVGASIGIAVAPEDGCEADALLRKADAALYRVKGAGKGAYALFEP